MGSNGGLQRTSAVDIFHLTTRLQTMCASLLSVRNLTYSVNHTPILTAVSLSIVENERVGLIGPNGSGKTSLFNILSGYVTPQSGEISLKGENITSMAPHHRARKGLGRTFQHSAIFRQMTVEENLLTALEQGRIFRTRPRSALREEVRGYLTRVGLADRARSQAGDLSGGQLRLLEIVRAIAAGSQLLLLDEPTAGVAPKMREELLALLHDLSSEGKTIIVIEHDIAFLRAWCERVVVLQQGMVALDGPTQLIETDPLLSEIYLGKRSPNDLSGEEGTR